MYCPNCSAKNTAASRFCTACGAPMKADDAASRRTSAKREKFLAPKRPAGVPWKPVAVFTLAAVIVAGILYTWTRPRTDEAAFPQRKVAGGIGYSSPGIEMTEVSPTVSDGKITIPLESVVTKKLVRFAHNGTPVLAYISPSGAVVTGISMCEPCSSTRFHIEGDAMVCNTCGTRWTLEDLRGISGGCRDYPPDAIRHTVVGDKIVIDETKVSGWRPRV